MENDEGYFQTSKERELKKCASRSMELSSGDIEKKEVELEVLAKEFAANKVSAAGVSYIVSSRSNVRRALWFIADAILHRLPFPGVTICSLNPISNHFVAETSLKKFLALKEMMDTATAERSTQHRQKNKDVRELIRLIKRSKTYDLDDIAEALMPSTKELYEYGSTYDTLVASCSYEGIHCYRENFTVLYDPTYGKCYMFNYIGSAITGSDKPIEIDTYGSTSGLQLLLRVTDNNALDLLRREIGARVVIHDPHILPFVSEYGVNVRPKDMTSLELSLSKVERLKAPWETATTTSKECRTGILIPYWSVEY
ncbi:degenerin unc-8 [Caerostris extrusa]|uniref:Degenerin unc-8 n=1 Tax=Caerostris extrusa TaxID=172846 RepID=A0AAV4MS85_CAEEX|nr:degenerin unc-8 [Caerostris extrusa]